MCSSSGACKRSDSAIFHSLSIPFKVSLDPLFTDSHLHCQGASRDLNQVLCGPAQANIFTCAHVLGPMHPVGLHCVCMKASRKTTACVFVIKTSRSVRQERRTAGSHICPKGRRSSGNDPADLKTTTSITFSPDTQDKI